MKTKKYGEASGQRSLPARLGIVVLLATGLLLLCAGSARAQSNFYWIAGTDVWSNAAAWTNELGTAAAPNSGGSIDYVIDFNNTNGFMCATNDLGTAANGGFLLNQLIADASQAALYGSNLVFENKQR